LGVAARGPSCGVAFVKWCVMAASSRVVGEKRVQYGALPYRLGDRSRTEIMLVTSREDATLDHPKGLASQGQVTASLRCTRSLRGGRCDREGQSNFGWVFRLQKTPQGRPACCLRSGSIPAQGKAADETVAGKPGTPGEVARGERSGPGRPGAHIANDHTPPGTGQVVGQVRTRTTLIRLIS
jgi:hypothetical protein